MYQSDHIWRKYAKTEEGPDKATEILNEKKAFCKKSEKEPLVR